MQEGSNAGQKAYAPEGMKRHMKVHAYRPIFMSLDAFMFEYVEHDYIYHVCVSVQTTVRFKSFGSAVYQSLAVRSYKAISFIDLVQFLFLSLGWFLKKTFYKR